MQSRYTTKLAPVLKNKVVTTYSPSIFNIIAIIIFIAFAIHPTIKTILARQKTISDQQVVLAQLQKKSKDLSDGINQFNAIPDETKIKFVTLLPNSTNLTCLVNDLTNQANGAGASINGLQIQPVELKGTTRCILGTQDLESYRRNLPNSLNLKEISFSVNTQGGFGQLSNYLSSFTNSTRLTNIESAVFNKPSDGSLIVIITAKAYYYQ